MLCGKGCVLVVGDCIDWFECVVFDFVDCYWCIF